MAESFGSVWPRSQNCRLRRCRASEILKGVTLLHSASVETISLLASAPPAWPPIPSETATIHGPLAIGAGPKGRAVAALASRTPHATAFVDDLLPNLDSVEAEAPGVHRFQSVADERLRPFAPSAPDRHPRFDSWTELAPAIARVLKLPS